MSMTLGKPERVEAAGCEVDGLISNLISGLLRERGRPPCVLVVDDQTLNIQVLYRTLAPEYRVLMATGGAKALELCRQDPPDLILLDVAMPDIDGYEVCARLKADPATRDIPVVFVSSHHSAEQETRGLELGGVDFIVKPINPVLVRARVKAQLTLALQKDLLHQIVRIDGLTRVSSRSGFDERWQVEWRRAARRGNPLGLLLLNVDAFRHYNQCYGHQAGDDCLLNLARAIKDSLFRPGDLVARIAGDWFACLLPETDATGAMTVAKRIQRHVSALRIEQLDSEADHLLTLSIGAASGVPECTADPMALLEQAEHRMRRARQVGRGGICAAEEQS